jgi:hypothetical protein
MMEAMKQALDALEMYLTLDTPEEANMLETDVTPRAYVALRQAIGQVEKQKPVAWFHEEKYRTHFTTDPSDDMIGKYWRPLYTEPRLINRFKQPCAGRNCGSTDPNLHSAECFEDYEKSTGMNDFKLVKQARPEWVSLTNEEIDAIQELPLSQNDYLTHYAYAIAAKLKEKNHG